MALTDIRNFQAIDERLGTAGPAHHRGGRSLEAKRNLYLSIVGSLKILLREIPREDLGIRGGQAASDVEPGFKIDV